jgi:hypothetical protein
MSMNNSIRTLNKFTVGFNVLTMCRFHEMFGHNCEGYKDSSTVALLVEVVLSVAMLRIDAIRGRPGGYL